MAITVGTLTIPTSGTDPKVAAKGTTEDAVEALVQGVVDQLGTAAEADSIDLLARGNHTGTQPADTLTETATAKVMTDTERTKLSAIEAGATADQTGAEIKIAYEAEPDTNAFTDAEKTKLGGIAAGATANATDAALLARANHTGEQPIGTVTDLTATLDALAPKANPTFTGTPTAPTAPTVTNTTQLATTAFVKAVVSALVDSSPASLDTLNELAAALGDDPNFATTITNLIGQKLAKSANLSDVGSVSASRINLGLGSAAVEDVSAFVSAAKGTQIDAETAMLRLARWQVNLDHLGGRAELRHVDATTFSVGWTTSQIMTGGTTARLVADRALSVLASNTALYINPDEAGTAPYTVISAAIDVSLQTLLIQGRAVLLAANLNGRPIGPLAASAIAATNRADLDDVFDARASEAGDRAKLTEIAAALATVSEATTPGGAVITIDPDTGAITAQSIYDIGGDMPLNWSNLSQPVGGTSEIIVADPVLASRAPRKLSIQNTSDTDSLWVSFGGETAAIGGGVAVGSYRVGPGAQWERDMPAGNVSAVSDGASVDCTIELGTVEQFNGSGLLKSAQALSAYPTPAILDRVWSSAYTRLVSRLGATGVLDGALFLALFSVPDEDMAAVDLVSGTSLFTPDNAPDFAPYAGYTLNGTDQRILTGIAPTNDVRIDHSAMVWTDATANDAARYALSAGDIAIAPYSTAISVATKSAATTADAVSGISAGGMKWLSRDNATGYTVGRNDGQVTAVTRAANASLVRYNAAIGCAVTGGVTGGQPAAASTHFAGQVKAAFMGRAQTAETMAAVWAALSQYETDIGGLV